MTSQARRQLGRGSSEAGPCGVPPFCTLHRFAPDPATARTDDANQADHTDEARRHAPSIANLRSQRRPLRPNAPFSVHPAEVDCTLSTTPTIQRTSPPRNGGFCYHRTPMTACRRRVAALWSQFPPDNKNKRGNRAPHALHRLGSTTPLCGTLLAIAWVVGSFGPCVAPCSGFFARPRDVVPQKCRT